MSAAKRQKNLLLRTLDPSFLGGVACTVAYYAVISQPVFRDTTLYHYTTEHSVEYVIVALFLWGLVDTVLKLIGFPKEFLSLRLSWLPESQGREPVSQAAPLLQQIQSQPRWLQDSRIGRRLSQSLKFVVEEGSAEKLRDQLQLLSENDDDQTHANYALPRFVAGVTPILGFLGTVVHFGTALSGISFEQMSERLPAIVAQMGTAFNTTTVALAASMTMMFTVFFCERIERALLHAVDRITDKDLLNRFDTHDANLVPFLGALQAASTQSLRVVDQTLHGQIEVFSHSLERLFKRFDERQQLELKGWDDALQTVSQQQQTYAASHETRFQELLAALDQRQAQHMDRIQQALERFGAITSDISELTKTLQTIARGEGRLAELQGTLTNNLRVIHETQQIDEALHGLTGAIHLLTARHHKNGNQDIASAA